MKAINRVEKVLETNHVFLTGGGGVGKSYLTEKIVQKYKENNRQVVVLGSTGISAVNIGGQTIHSFFAFGICQNEDELVLHDRQNKNRIKTLNKLLTHVDLIVIDEISMVSAFLLDMVRYRLTNANFSGRVLFVGDFFQLPPVIKKDSPNSLFNEVYAFESSAWSSFEPVIFELVSSKRTEDLEFFEVLKKIREGTLTEDMLIFLSNLRENREVYANKPTILFGRNYEADQMNRLKLNELEGELFTMHAREKLQDNLHLKRFEGWKKSLNVPLKLELKIGANVIFCVNSWGKYYNGEQGVIKEITDEYLLVEKDNQLVKVELHEFTMGINVLKDGAIKNEILAHVSQFPVKLSYALTIHKSQSMSIKNLVCDINNIFETSQFYAAISRAISPKSLLLEYSGNNFGLHVRKCIHVDEKVQNFYKNSKIEIVD